MVSAIYPKPMTPNSQDASKNAPIQNKYITLVQANAFAHLTTILSIITVNYALQDNSINDSSMVRGNALLIVKRMKYLIPKD